MFPEKNFETNFPETSDAEDFKILYALLFILCFFSNGFVPSISTFIAMPYGVKGMTFEILKKCILYELKNHGVENF